MLIERRIAFERHVTEAFLRVALQAALVRMGELSGSQADEALGLFENSFVRGLRSLTGPKGAELETLVAVEDTITTLRKTIDCASKEIAEGKRSRVRPRAIAA